MEAPTENEATMILVMGVTGSGKSYFVNKLAGENIVVESDALDSCTAICKGVPVSVGKSRTLLIDTPGFDDSKRSDTEILTEISRMLVAQYKLGVSLKGIIYLHRITDLRYPGSSVRTLDIFRKLCGDEALSNVILATTRWQDEDPVTGSSRESRLRQGFWSEMLDCGAKMTRFHGDRDSAVGMVSQLLGSASIVLDIQKELVDQGKTLDQTGAGSLVNENLDSLKKQHARELAELEERHRNTNTNEAAITEQLRQERNAQRAWMQQAENDQVRLRTDVANDVREEIEMEVAKKRKKSKRFGFDKVLPFLPTAISILGMFVGIPSGATSILTSWFTDAGLGDAFSEIFANF